MTDTGSYTPSFKATAPHVDPSSGQRTQFTNYAWVEINKSGARGVLDATHALGGGPEVGLNTREAYLYKALDRARSIIDPSTRKDGVGACCKY